LQVASINVSGHKYGLALPGIGFVLWRTKDYLPKDMVFPITYLGGDEQSVSLNFSRNASQLVGQYYMLLRLGKKGYTEIMTTLLSVKDYLVTQLEASGTFQRVGQAGIPCACLRLTDKPGGRKYTVFDISERMREYGWFVPAYNLVPKADKIAVLRVIVREGFSRDAAERFAQEVGEVVKKLEGEYHADTNSSHPRC
jgi:glutamate decarboxylase